MGWKGAPCTATFAAFIRSSQVGSEPLTHGVDDVDVEHDVLQHVACHDPRLRVHPVTDADRHRLHQVDGQVTTGDVVAREDGVVARRPVLSGPELDLAARAEPVAEVSRGVGVQLATPQDVGRLRLVRQLQPRCFAAWADICGRRRARRTGAGRPGPASGLR